MAETPIALTRKAAGVLEDRGVDNARLEAELLLASVLGVRRLELYLQHERPLTPEEVAAYRTAVRRRLRHEPVQYIVGEVEFRELTLAVDRRTLIPRPETELLVGEVLRWAVGRERVVALDIGTGCGAIALSLLFEGPFERAVATDVSADALEVAAENARRVGLSDGVELREGSLWEPVPETERYDVVVSNPPYVAEADRETLPPEVREWEPAVALFAPAAGLQLIGAIADGAPARLRAGGLLALEVGVDQAQAAAERIEAAGAYGPPEIVRDYAGRARIVRATRAEHSDGNPTERDG